MFDLLLGMFLSVCNRWFRNMATFPSALFLLILVLAHSNYYYYYHYHHRY